MFISTNWKARLCSGNVLEKAQLLFSQYRVSMAMYKYSGDRVRMRATIIDSGEFHVELAATNNGELFGAFCGCREFNRERGRLCPHCAAALMFNYALENDGRGRYFTDCGNITCGDVLDGSDCYDRNIDGNYTFKDRTKGTAVSLDISERLTAEQPVEDAVKLDARERERIRLSRSRSFSLLDAYSAKDDTPAFGLNAVRGVCLEPCVDLSELKNGLILSFNIRRLSREEALQKCSEEDAAFIPERGSRSYIVKNVDSLLSSVLGGSVYTYGKALSFAHTERAFEPVSRRWLDFLRRWRKKCPMSYSYYVDSSKKDRFLRLTPDALDELYSDFFDCGFEISGMGNGIRPLFSDEPANAEITLRRESGGISLLFNGIDRVFVGNYIYVFDGTRLKRFGAQASTAMRELMNEFIVMNGSVSFFDRQLTDVCGLILPSVKPYVTLNNAELLDAYAADEFSPVVLIDAPDRDTISLVPAACYRDILLELPSGTPIAQLIRKDGGGIELNADISGETVRFIRRNTHFEKRFFSGVCRCAELGADAVSGGSPLLIKGGDAIYKFLTVGSKILGEAAELIASDRVKRLTVTPPSKVSVGISLESGLLELSIGTDVPLDELHAVLDAYREKRRYFRLKSGAFLTLDEDDAGLRGLAMLENGLQLDAKQLAKKSVSIPAFRAMYLDGLFSDEAFFNVGTGVSVSKDAAFTALTERLKNFLSASCPEPPSLSGILREYQRSGYRWLRCLEDCSFGGILADDMGLGKTLQLTAVLLARYESCLTAGTNAPPSLIVCPSSLVLNWKKELERFAPSLPVRVVQGTAQVRAGLIRDIQPNDIVITSYDLLKRDAEEYSQHKFHYFAIDEAQYIKNHATLAAEAVKRIDCVQRYALTGTPIENRLSELWSIFDFLMPGYLYKYTRFKQRFEQPIVKDGDETARSSLRALIMPFILRRLKCDVLSELPPKTTVVVPIELCQKQRELYSAAILSGLGVLKDENGGAAKIQALALLTRLRRICCDPSLCYESYKHESSKLEACMELLKQAKDGGHRTLLFSQYTDMLDIIQPRAEAEGFFCLRLQGSTPPSKRLELVEHFNSGDADIFLISLKAGGTGLNLTGADTVILYDPWWNTAAQDQATDRAHRIGQTSPVQVYKLIAQDTIEEKILELQQKKDALASIVDGEGALSSMSVDDIIDLLRSRED